MNEAWLHSTQLKSYTIFSAVLDVLQSNSTGDDNDIAGQIDEEMLEDAVAGHMTGGYGSTHDGDNLLIAVCDACVEIKKASGHIIYNGNYMFPDDENDEV